MTSAERRVALLPAGLRAAALDCIMRARGRHALDERTPDFVLRSDVESALRAVRRIGTPSDVLGAPAWALLGLFGYAPGGTDADADLCIGVASPRTRLPWAQRTLAIRRELTARALLELSA